MHFLVFSSLRQFYSENLLPIASYLESRGHQVDFSAYYTRLGDHDHVERVLLGRRDSPYSEFMRGELRPDAVIMSQCWWGQEPDVVEKCNQRDIAFYLIEHAAQMMPGYGKRHEYRLDIRGARAHFMWGKESRRIMKGNPTTGCCNGPLTIGGAPRLDGLAHYERSEEPLAILYTGNNDRYEELDDYPRRLAKLQRWIKGHGMELVIRPHPRKRLDQLGDLDPSVTRVHAGGTTEENLALLARAKFTIFPSPSSMMIPAAVMRKRIVCWYEHHPQTPFRLHIQRNRKVFAISQGELTRVADSPLNERAYQKFVDRNLFRPPEGAAAYIGKLVLGNLQGDVPFEPCG
ncbi:hypothetical protein [Aeoliella sp.]|uniref:hypothetical protein n=1 Tax=Aeoliella sp. TaxID=2795800 RepID=UPI003CCC41B3